MPLTPNYRPPDLMVGVTSDRITAVSPAARAVHKAILRAFATGGRPPEPAALTEPAAQSDPAPLLAELHDHDVIRLDDQGRIRAAYPFSAVPTVHRVAIDRGPTVWSMCAIDALGIADMLDRHVTITSADPSSGEQIQVTIGDGQAGWRPDTAVVVVGSDTRATAAGGPCCSPEATGQACAVVAADRSCGATAFFTSRDTARHWVAAHPHVSGVVLTQEQAQRLGVDIFGRLLAD